MSCRQSASAISIIFKCLLDPSLKMNLQLSRTCCILLLWMFVCVSLPGNIQSQSLCVSGRHHKAAPGPEDLSNTSCAAWGSRACCSRKTATDLSANATDGTWLNFQWDHCVEDKRPPLSAACRKYFTLDLCFYECSPNVGPWLIQDKRKIRDNRFANIPFCQSQCDAWYNACKDDWTCTDNWSKNFKWTSGKNECPPDAKCRQFKDVYQNSAQTFCETVFDHSFKYSSDMQPCMRIDFNDSKVNDQVEQFAAEYPARFLRYQNGSLTASSAQSALLLVFLLLTVILFC